MLFLTLFQLQLQKVFEKNPKAFGHILDLRLVAYFSSTLYSKSVPSNIKVQKAANEKHIPSLCICNQINLERKASFRSLFSAIF